MNQSALGEKMGLTQSQVSKVEQGKAVPGLWQVLSAAAVLRVSLDQLVHGMLPDYDAARDQATPSDGAASVAQGLRALAGLIEQGARPSRSP